MHDQAIHGGPMGQYSAEGPSWRPPFTPDLESIEEISDSVFPQDVDRIGEIIEMKCPVNCSGCMRMIELEDAVFYTEHCECGGFETCTHGFCEHCAR